MTDLVPAESQNIPSGGGESSGQVKAGKLTLRQRFFRATFWSAGHGIVQQGLRLISNLIIARILVPNDFGVMAIITTTLQMLQTFSDIGIGPSIIQNKRGDDPKFVNSAWTIQVVRGFGLWFIGCLLAWPMSKLNAEYARLILLLPVACTSAAISGFASTSLFTAKRRLALGRFVALELGSKVIGLVIIVSLVWIYKSVWGIVVGNLVTILVRTIGSHIFLPGHRNRFYWDPSAGRELIHFGKWIFLSTLIGFLATRADPLILGKFVSPAELGLLFIAMIWPRAVTKFITRTLSNVMLPLFSRLNDRGHEEFYKKTLKIRYALILPTFVPLFILILLGPTLVELFYLPDYHAAGWMVQIIAISHLIRYCFGDGRDILLARGDSKRFALIMAVNLAAKISGMAIGGYLLGGLKGVLWGAAFSPLATYPIVAWGLHKHRMWMPIVDLVSVIFAILVVGIGWYISGGI